MSGPPWVHAFASEPEPEAVTTRLRWPFWYVNVCFGIGHVLTYREGWTCAGRWWAESKARRELARLRKPPAPTFTITL